MSNKILYRMIYGCVKTILIISVFIFGFSLAFAEKIHFKDGRIVDANITFRSKDSVWINYNTTSTQGAVGISASEIRKIQEGDGSISKHDYASLIKQIEEHINQKKYNEAVKTCDILLGSFSSDPQIRYLRAVLHQKIGNIEKAVEDYDFLIQNKNGSVKVFNNLGAIYANKKEYIKAKDLFLKALQENPDMAEAHENLAELFLETEDYAMAIEEYKKAIELEPDNVTAHFNLGIAYEKCADFSKAKDAWERALAINPEDNDARDAITYLETKDYKF